MNNILTALATKISGSTLYSTLSGRIWLDTYQGDSPITFPYCIYSIVSAPMDKTFTETYRDLTIQFSIYSTSTSAAEITDLYNSLNALLDEQDLGTITSNTLVYMREANLVTMVEEIPTSPEASQTAKVWHVDFEIEIYNGT